MSKKSLKNSIDSAESRASLREIYQKQQHFAESRGSLREILTMLENKKA